jgi:hypothetical protein
LTTLLLVFLVVGLGAGRSLLGDQARSPSSVESAFGATRPASEHDADVIAGLSRFLRSWNEAAGPFVEDYQNPNIAAGEWVASATEHVDQMRSAVRGLDAAVMTLDDPGLRNTFAPLVDNYRAKFADVVSLWNAVAAGDSGAEAQATAALTSDAQNGRALASEFLDRLRPFMTPDQLDRLGDIIGGN